jgi:lipopolysaccharide transport system permease protein
MYLFSYHELIKNLVLSDLKTKYSNSVLGFVWSLLNPLAMLIVLSIVFSNVFNSQGNYVVYLLIGMLSWRFFAAGTGSAMSSIVGKSSLVTKVRIPREILTLSTVISSMISSILEFLVVLPLLVVFNVGLHPAILLFPVVHLVFFMIIYGVGLIIASLYVYYRDMNQIWDVALQAGFFLSPIVYPLSLIPESYELLYNLNPITAIINMYRDIFISGQLPGSQDFLVALTAGLILIVAGHFLFGKLSRRFAEVI